MIKVILKFETSHKVEDFFKSWIWEDYLLRIVNLGRCISFEVKEEDD